MSEEQNVEDPSVNEGSGMSRRRMLTASAVGGAAVWIAPSVVGVQQAGAAVSPMMCTSTSRDIFLTTSGVVSGEAGPIQSYPDDPGCLSNQSVQIPSTNDPQVTAEEFCASGEDAGTGTEGVCTASATVARVDIDLTSLGIPVTGSAVVLSASKECGGVDSTDSQVAGLSLTVDGTPLVIPADPPDNTVIPLNIPGVIDLMLTLNGDFGDCRRAFDLQVSTLSLLGDPIQSAHLIIAEACCSD